MKALLSINILKNLQVLLASEASELSHVRVQLRFQIRTCIYVYIYVAVR